MTEPPQPASIMTITANILLEWTFTQTTWETGKTHRAQEETFQVGGKGINASRMLSMLGNPTTACYFCDQTTEPLIASWFKSREFAAKSFPLGNTPRPGFVIRSPEMPETTFLGRDRPIPFDSWNSCWEFLSAQSLRAIAICGSIPGWSPDFLEPVSRFLEEYDGISILDTYGAPLADMHTLPFDWIKINRDEWNALFESHRKRSSEKSSWIITDKHQPIDIYHKRDGTFQITPASIEEVSPTGSGDVFLAVFLNALERGWDWQDSVWEATWAGTTNALRSDIAAFTPPYPKEAKPGPIQPRKN